jgi:RNA ligase (TIGR02306 family)
MRKLSYPSTIAALAPIAGADRLELASLSGHAWKCVVGKGEFHPGQRVVYFEIDSALPVDDERYAFLASRCLKRWKLGDKVLDSCYRIRTMTLRGTLSQGLVLPFSAFPEIAEAKDGDDVTEALRVRHYDDLASEMQAIIAPNSGDLKQKGPFPSFIPKTDEERIQNLADWPELYPTVGWSVTRKCDGTSMTAFYEPARKDDEFGVCSRNFELKLDADNAYTRMAAKLDLREKLKVMADCGLALAVQGELVGPGINGNRDRLTEPDWLVFRIWNIDRQEWLTVADCHSICRELELRHVPVVDSVITLSELGSVDEILRYAEGRTENGNEREGVVFREIGTTHPKSFKAVSNRYLLQNKEA